MKKLILSLVLLFAVATTYADPPWGNGGNNGNHHGGGNNGNGNGNGGSHDDEDDDNEPETPINGSVWIAIAGLVAIGIAYTVFAACTAVEIKEPENND